MTREAKMEMKDKDIKNTMSHKKGKISIAQEALQDLVDDDAKEEFADTQNLLQDFMTSLQGDIFADKELNNIEKSTALSRQAKAEGNDALAGIYQNIARDISKAVEFLNSDVMSDVMGRVSSLNADEEQE